MTTNNVDKRKGRWTNKQLKELKESYTHLMDTYDLEVSDICACLRNNKSNEKINLFWKDLRSLFTNRSYNSIFDCVNRLLMKTVVDGWTDEEKENLIILIGQHGANYKLISRQLGRSTDDVRQCYKSLNRPDAKGKFTEQENEKLCTTIIQYCKENNKLKDGEIPLESISWSEISKRMNNERMPDIYYTKWLSLRHQVVLDKLDNTYSLTSYSNIDLKNKVDEIFGESDNLITKLDQIGLHIQPKENHIELYLNRLQNPLDTKYKYLQTDFELLEYLQNSDCDDESEVDWHKLADDLFTIAYTAHTRWRILLKRCPNHIKDFQQQITYLITVLKERNLKMCTDIHISRDIKTNGKKRKRYNKIINETQISDNVSVDNEKSADKNDDNIKNTFDNVLDNDNNEEESIDSTYYESIDNCNNTYDSSENIKKNFKKSTNDNNSNHHRNSVISNNNNNKIIEMNTKKTSKDTNVQSTNTYDKNTNFPTESNVIGFNDSSSSYDNADLSVHFKLEKKKKKKKKNKQKNKDFVNHIKNHSNVDNHSVTEENNINNNSHNSNKKDKGYTIDNFLSTLFHSTEI